MKLSGSKITLTQTLLARIADELSFQSWAKTKDGQKNRNRPESILKALTTEKVDTSMAYETIDDFKKAWGKICQTAESQ